MASILRKFEEQNYVNLMQKSKRLSSTRALSFAFFVATFGFKSGLLPTFIFLLCVDCVKIVLIV